MYWHTVCFSWVYYNFRQDKLSYYSSNLGHFYQSGHPFLFEPATRTTYIGLNRRYETSSFRGKGLCRVYCKVTYSFPFITRRRGRNHNRGSTLTSDQLSGVSPQGLAALPQGVAAAPDPAATAGEGGADNEQSEPTPPPPPPPSAN